MSWSAVSSTVSTIGKLLAEEAIYLWGVEEQVDRLQTELRWMQSSLMEADVKQDTDERIRLWVAEIKELAYDAEDVIEHFALKFGYRNRGGLSGCIERSACILKEARTLHETRSKIEKIIAKIDELIRRLQAYGIKEFRDGKGSSSLMESRRPYPHVMDHNIVGLDDDIEKLVSVLVDAERAECKVVSVWGMGGLGKTTTAKKLYHHSQLNSHFDNLVWVYVSQQCQKRNVWEGILSSLLSSDKDGIQGMTTEGLAEKIYDLLKQRRCLVILDDIWSNEAWDSLKSAFPVEESSSTSKILLTTRNENIVSHADINGHLHVLRPLNDAESWELFQKIAFPPSNHTESTDDEAAIKKLGEKMVKDCAGLPLAIILLGGVLATKNKSLIEWNKVSDNVKSYLKSGKGQGAEDVLALSYDDLPYYLRPCFLYLSHFPEDYEIEADRLIQLWVAEGIVPLNQEQIRDGGEFPEDVAERYLMELAERCMILVRERDVATLKVKTFQMHDLMRDVCLSKAKQENFLFIVDQSNASSSIIQKVRRVSAHEFLWTQSIKSPNLRSLLFFNLFMPSDETVVPQKILSYLENHEDEYSNPLYLILLIWAMGTALPKAHGQWSYIFNNLKFLRVLSIEVRYVWGGRRLLNSISNLIHLRFFSLRNLYFQRIKIPSSLGNLRCLQTLDLRLGNENYVPVHVPNVIWRMEQLRHLYLPYDCDSKTKLKLGTLRNLLTLVNFNTQSCYLKDLINMPNLRELEIRGHFNIENFDEEDLDKNPPILQGRYLRSLSITFSQWAEKSIDPRHLTHLLSSCNSICKLSLEKKMIKLPDYLPSSIEYIRLKGSNLPDDPMPVLEKMPKLRILQLLDGAFTKREMLCSAPGFPKLESLRIEQLGDLEEWKVDDGAMPALHNLEIARCDKLNMDPVRSRFNGEILKIEEVYEVDVEELPDP